MPVRKRGNTWSWYFDMAKINGKRQRKEKGGYKTKAEAEKALAKAKEEYETCGKITFETEMSVHDFMNYFYENYSLVKLKYYTIGVHANCINKHIIPAIGHLKLKSITPAVLQNIFDDMYKNGYAKETLKKVYGVLSKSFKMANYPWEFLKTNPMDHVSLRDYRYNENEELKIVSKEDFNTIANYYRSIDHYFWIVIQIAWHTGMRRGEILALRWQDIDLINKTIHIKHSIVFKKGGVFELMSPKTSSSYRKIAIGDTLVSILSEHKERMKLLHPNIDFVCIKPTTGKLINIYDTKYMNLRTQQMFNIHFDLHSLRHSHATMLIEGGVPMKAVSERLGHNNIATTMDIYTHVTKKIERDSVNVFESMI